MPRLFPSIPVSISPSDLPLVNEITGLVEGISLHDIDKTALLNGLVTGINGVKILLQAEIELQEIVWGVKRAGNFNILVHIDEINTKVINSFLYFSQGRYPLQLKMFLDAKALENISKLAQHWQLFEKLNEETLEEVYDKFEESHKDCVPDNVSDFFETELKKEIRPGFYPNYKDRFNNTFRA